MRVIPVQTEDGVPLHVEVHDPTDGPTDAPATIALLHGYVLSRRLWDRQVAALTAARPDLRVVTYDHRGHGDSGRSPSAGASIAQLGRDLMTVLDAAAPDGPLVLVGHSMGGMTIMAAAEQDADLFGTRVAGVALVATSSADLDGLTFGAPPALAKRIRAALPRVVERGARLEDAGRPPLPMPYLRPLLFGRGAARQDVRRTVAEIRGTSLRTLGDFLPTFLEHQRTAALAVLRDLPVVLLCGDRDRLTPLAHSKAIARALPRAQFHVYPGAGHMLQLERADEVSRRLVDLAAALPVRPLRATFDSYCASRNV